ncbi:MAG TPA: hypothetical protein VGX27_09270 [Candidatus Dormibacteraeota bacterium]|nr:hypothetical protein [Candidatus Dormibacteraeota bacterium]
MNPRRFQQLLVAPELLVIDLSDAALVALRRALRTEHPTLDDPAVDHPPVHRRALLILRLAARLRRALRAYRRAVDDVLRLPPDNDLPF